jgi:hypothetical protein
MKVHINTNPHLEHNPLRFCLSVILFLKELICTCLACLQCLDYPLLLGDRYGIQSRTFWYLLLQWYFLLFQQSTTFFSNFRLYYFVCAVCNNGEEYFKRMQLKWYVWNPIICLKISVNLSYLTYSTFTPHALTHFTHSCENTWK